MFTHHVIDALHYQSGITLFVAPSIIVGIQCADGIHGDIDDRYHFHVAGQLLLEGGGGHRHHLPVGFSGIVSRLHVEEFDIEFAHPMVFHPLLLPVCGVVGGLPMVYSTVGGCLSGITTA